MLRSYTARLGKREKLCTKLCSASQFQRTTQFTNIRLIQSLAFRSSTPCAISPFHSLLGRSSFHPLQRLARRSFSRESIPSPSTPHPTQPPTSPRARGDRLAGAVALGGRIQDRGMEEARGRSVRSRRAHRIRPDRQGRARLDADGRRVPGQDPAGRGRHGQVRHARLHLRGEQGRLRRLQGLHARLCHLYAAACRVQSAGFAITCGSIACKLKLYANHA